MRNTAHRPSRFNEIASGIYSRPSQRVPRCFERRCTKKLHESAITENASFAMKGSEREAGEKKREGDDLERVYSPSTAVTSATTRDIGCLGDRTSMPPLLVVVKSTRWPRTAPRISRDNPAGRCADSSTGMRANRRTAANCLRRPTTTP